MELALSGNMVVATSSPLLKHNTGSQSFSRFRGVISLRSGNFGSRIAFKYKAYWLGTYDTEEEAAMTYDRASIKLQRSGAPLNFPVSVYTVEEMRFQEKYSTLEILDMLKDKIYSAKFADFLAGESLARRSGGEIFYQLLFKKELTNSDIANIKGFHIPRECAVQHFPPLAVGGERKWMELTFADKNGRSWSFRYSFWKSMRAYVLTKGWRHFIKMNSLKAGDSVVFYRCGRQGEDEGETYYVIDVERAGMEGYLLMGPDGEINGGDDEEMGEGENGGEIKLFGVWVGTGGRAGKRRKIEESRALVVV